MGGKGMAMNWSSRPPKVIHNRGEKMSYPQIEVGVHEYPLPSVGDSKQNRW